LGAQLRRVCLFEWLTLLPLTLPLPHTLHTLDIIYLLQTFDDATGDRTKAIISHFDNLSASKHYFADETC
jgi:hypothetical protein